MASRPPHLFHGPSAAFTTLLSAVQDVVLLHCLTMEVLLDRGVQLALLLQYLLLLTWKSRGRADFESETHMD